MNVQRMLASDIEAALDEIDQALRQEQQSGLVVPDCCADLFDDDLVLLPALWRERLQARQRALTYELKLRGWRRTHG